MHVCVCLWRGALPLLEMGRTATGKPSPGGGREEGDYNCRSFATLKLYQLKCTPSQLLQPREGRMEARKQGGMKIGRKAGGKEKMVGGKERE